MEAIEIISISDAHYPQLLREIPDPPVQLYVRGNIDLLSHSNLLAVVGSRLASTYGREVILNLLRPIISVDVPIVSGLAFGIDSLAHQICVDSGRPTIAVLGGGIDDATIAPRSNFSLAQKILATGGAIVSEYAPGLPPNKGSFPERNRIIAGLSTTVLIVQARQRSGSLITARLALEYNREVCAVPGRITDPLSQGTNELIQFGATPILTADDLLDIMKIESKPIEPTVVELSSEQQSILKKLSDEPQHIDEVTAAIRLPAEQVAVLLTELELLEQVRSVGSMKYVRL